MTAQRHEPYRRCIQCRTPLPKRELLRVVRRPDWSILVDASGKLSGRGAYVCRKEGCVEVALKSGRLDKALRAKVPQEVAQELSGLAAQRSGT